MSRHDLVLEFIRNNHRAVIATHRGDGSAQLSPVIAGVDDAGRVIVSSVRTAVKVRHLLNDPRASICVMADHFFGEWHSAEGNVEVFHLPEAMEALVAYYRGVSGEHPDWDEYRAAMEAEGRVLLRLTVERSGPGRPA